MNTAITPADKLVMALSLVLLIFLYGNYWSGGQARQAEVLVGGKKQYLLDLSENKTVEIQGKLGKSVIEVKNGKIHFLDSPCSGKVCIHSGWVSQVNSFIACLPNGVSLHLSGPNARFDSINF